MSLLSFTSFSPSLAFSAGRRRESASTSTHLLPPLRWNRCFGLARPVRVGFLGSATEPTVVRFVPRGISAGAEDLIHDAGATVAILVGGYALVFGFNELTRREVLQQVSGNLALNLTCMHVMNLADSLLDFFFSLGSKFFRDFIVDFWMEDFFVTLFS